MPYVNDPNYLSAPVKSGAGLVAANAIRPRFYVGLWPYQSLPRTGFVWFIGGTSALISLPLITLIGSPVLWGMLPFLLMAVAGIWWALQRNYSDGEIIEHLMIWPDRMTLTRIGPRAKRAEWQANPYWVTPILHKTGGPVPNYITLRGGDREVELGAFLSQEERIALFDELTDMLYKIK